MTHLTTARKGIDEARRPPNLRVLVVAQVRLYGEGLAVALAKQPGLSVVNIAPACRAETVMAEARPDVVLVDSAVVRSTNIVPLASDAGVRAVAFAVAEEDEAEVLECVEAGVAGVVNRDASVSQLTTALREAARGNAHCSPRVAALLIRRLASMARPHSRVRGVRALTRREQEIGGLVEAGLSNKEIADKLGIAVPTVKNHVHSLIAKLEVSRRGEAAANLRALAHTPHTSAH